MRADPKVGEAPGGLQAPHVIYEQNKWHMFYGGWDAICHAVSDDGKIFKRVVQDNQCRVTAMFSEGAGMNTRDAMVLKIDDTYYCYYTAGQGLTSDNAHLYTGKVYCRKTKDLIHWSDSTVVSQGGRTGPSWSAHECPHVVYIDGYYYLFRTQHYGSKNAPTVSSVYRSKNPLDFGVGYDTGYFVCTLPVAAPELVLYEKQWYIAALNPGLDGIRIARLKWVPDNKEDK